MKRVLIVCTGNVCRSPMAMGLLRQRLAQDGLDSQVSVSSAGVYGLDGSAASRPGVDVLAERGIDISEHRARTIDQKEVAQADLVLVMEEAQRRTLFYTYPEQLHKIFLDKRDVRRLSRHQGPLSAAERRVRALRRRADKADRGWLRDDFEAA